MITNDAVRHLALAFPNSSEEPHFEKTSFRVKKKIFATLTEKKRQAVLKLTIADQDVYWVKSNKSRFCFINVCNRIVMT